MSIHPFWLPSPPVSHRTSLLAVFGLIASLSLWTPAAEAQPSFSTAKGVGPFSDVSGPEWVELVDLDGDADLDIVVAADNHVIWYPNQGNGSFGDYERIAEGAIAALIGDLDGDSHSDVLTVHSDERGLEWHRNDGEGRFSAVHREGPAVGFLAATIADFDGDADLDIAAVNRLDLVLLLNDGVGGFAFENQSISAQIQVGDIWIEAVDRDEDGDMDLAIANWNTVSWFENDAHGAFAYADQVTALDLITDTECADLDGEAASELIVATHQGWGSGTNGLRILRNGGREAPTASLYDRRVTSITSTDLDGDGNSDMVASLNPGWGSSEETGLIWFQNGVGGHWSEARVAAATGYGPTAMAAGDLDGDGDNDIVGIERSAPRLVVYLNEGDGTLNPRDVTSASVGRLSALAVSDVDNDGRPDLTAAGAYDMGIFRDFAGGTEPAVFEHYGLPSLTGGIAAGDLDADGDVDIVVGGDFWQTFLENEGDGTFSEGGLQTDGGYGIAEVWIGDMDLDGDPDLLTTERCFSTCNWHGWHENDGSGSFTYHLIYNDIAETSAFADFDGDGDIDVALAYDMYQGQAVILCTREENDFSCSKAAPSGTGAYSVAPGDLDGDGDIDLVAASPSTDEILWLANDGTGHFSPYTITSLEAWSVSLADLDVDGDLDLVASSGGAFAWSQGFDGGFVVWIENLGAAAFGDPQRLAEGGRGLRALVADVNMDGMPDIITASPDNGKISWYENLTVSVGLAEDLALPPSLPVETPYPNPFGVRTALEFSLPEPARVRLEVFDLLGRKVARPIDAYLPAGTHETAIDAHAWADGVYLYRLSAGKQIVAGRLVRVR